MQLSKTQPGQVCFTPQELNIVRRAVRGLQHKEIAAQLGISMATVGAHLGRVRQCLGLHTMVELAHWCHLQPEALEGKFVPRVPAAVINEKAA
jgi:DNA-binding NarL/FixJ family response regulator